MPTQNQRYEWVDTLRGFALLNMIVYHLLYDLHYVMGVPMPWYEGRAAYMWQQGICWGFVLISGFTWNLGRHRLRRGGQVFAAGLVITAATYVFMPSEKIFFGVLSFLGLSMLLLTGSHRWLKKCSPWAGLFLSLALFGFTKHLASGYLGFFGTPIFWLPKNLYANYGTTILGLPFPGFYSSDYVPLFPGFFMFLAGYFLWHLISREGKLPQGFQKGLPGLTWLGKNSLWIYMVHQVVLMAALMGLASLGIF